MLFSDDKNLYPRDWGIYGVLQNETNFLNMFYIKVPNLGVCRDLCSDPYRSLWGLYFHKNRFLPPSIIIA